MLAHRKQGPVLPTMVINIVPDPVTDKLRKRRSSRTAGLTATKDTAPTTLWFRAGDDNYTLQDWTRFIQTLVQPNIPDKVPLSPVTPGSPSFINPFAPRSRDPSESLHRPTSGSANTRPAFPGLNSNPPYSSRESGRDRPLTFSESPSLRSKRSDISSQTSSLIPSHLTYQNYTAMHPADLPSPATTIGEYQGEFIEGWTSAQGRSSTLSSPVRGRDSVGSQVPVQLPPIMDSGSPPGPRETILDRAFQLRCIPGSEREIPGEEKLSSLARFDALMREVDVQRQKREADEARTRAASVSAATSSSTVARAAALGLGPSTGLKSGWDLDDSSESDSDQDVEDDSDGPEIEGDDEDHFPIPPSAQIPPTARRALDFIASRHEPPVGSLQQPPPPRSQGPSRTPLSYNHDALMALSSSGSSHLRPQTGYSKARSRPAMASRTHSQPQLAEVVASSAAGAALSNLGKSPEESPEATHTTPGLYRSVTSGPTEKRQSGSSRLSFSEFTKRLSSTSSLLLVQTNASGGSSRGSNSELDAAQQQAQQHHLHPRNNTASSSQSQQQLSVPESPEKRCGWRGSVGVFGGAEGGFL